MAVQTLCDVLIIDDPRLIQLEDSPLGKPYLRLKFEDGTRINITTNLAEMIGGVGAGLRKRLEDQKK